MTDLESSDIGRPTKDDPLLEIHHFARSSLILTGRVA